MYRKARNKADILSGVDKPVNVSKSRKLARSTVMAVYEDGTEAVRYHDTDVVTFNLDGSVTLDSGGFRTVTTKNRINEYTDLCLYQEKSIWYVGARGKEKHVFHDGITFDAQGELVTEPYEVDNDHISKTKKAIKKFVSLIDSMEELPLPSSGDCIMCMAGIKSCLKDHMKENYLHGSLIYAALKERGCNDPSIYFAMNLRDDIKRALYNYMKRELLPELAR